LFTGIVAACGEITAVNPLGAGDSHGFRLLVQANQLDLTDVNIGDSIAIQGACMTVVQLQDTTFAVDVSAESLDKTVGLNAPGPVNLEKAMRLSDRIGGHLVSGHVDGLGRVKSFTQVGESWELRIAAPATLARYLAYKGSVVVNGVSLTVNDVQDLADGPVISINLIPHTVENTTLKSLSEDDAVNLEIDLIARYVDRMNQVDSQSS
jgi:riboflavin synthase